MSGFDDYIIRCLNSFAFRYPGFDAFVVVLMKTNLVKGGVIAALICWAWALGGEQQRVNRAKILSMLVAAFGAMFTARALAHALPFRVRPISDATTGIHFPINLDHEALSSWSSFPSDHASLFFALSAGLWLVSRRIGVVALLHTVLIICLPRIYLGFHYPTDIIAGAVIGISWVVAARASVFQKTLVQPGLRWSERHAPSFYLAFFLLLQQISTIFEDARAVGVAVLDALRNLL
jgi:undecaprenyl-diphosphatase